MWCCCCKCIYMFTFKLIHQIYVDSPKFKNQAFLNQLLMTRKQGGDLNSCQKWLPQAETDCLTWAQLCQNNRQ